MSALAWLRRPCRPSSPPDASSYAGRRPDARRPASSSDSSSLPAARAAAGVRPAALGLRRGLRPVLAAALLALPLLAALPTGAQAQTTQTFVGNTGQATGNSPSLSNDFAQAFTTGTNSDGYSLRSVEAVYTTIIANLASSPPAVSIRTDSGGSPGVVVGTLTNPASFPVSNSEQTLTYTSAGIDLSASTTYFLVFDSGSAAISGNYQSTTNSDSEDSGALGGWSIGNSYSWRLHDSTGAWTSNAASLKISLGGVVNPVIASLLPTSDSTFTEQIPSDTAAVTVRLSRRLHAGEQLEVPLEWNQWSGLNAPHETDPSFSVSVSGNGATGRDLTGDIFYVRFTGHGTDIVQEATVTLTPTNVGDADTDGGRIEIEVSQTAEDWAASTFTNVGGGERHATNNQIWLTYADDDDVPVGPPGITVGAPGQVSSVATLGVLEGGSTAITVVLDSQPSGTVTVTASGHSGTDVRVDTDEGTPGDQTSLTFTPSNWNVRQRVTLRAVEDADKADEATFTLTFAASGTTEYAGITDTTSVDVSDNDIKDSYGRHQYTYTGFFTQSTFVAREDAGFVQLEFRLSRALPEAVTLLFRYDDLTADSRDYRRAEPYVAGRTHVSVPAGQTNVAFRVPLADDKGVEGNELFRINLVKGPKYETGGQAIQTDVIIQDPPYWTHEFPDGNYGCFGVAPGKVSSDYPPTGMVDDPQDPGNPIPILHRGEQLSVPPAGIDVAWDKASYRAGEDATVTFRTTDGKRSCMDVWLVVRFASQTAEEVAGGVGHFTQTGDDHPLYRASQRWQSVKLARGKSEASVRVPLSADGRVGYRLVGGATGGSPVRVQGAAVTSMPTAYVWRTVAAPTGVSFARRTLEVRESTAGTVNLKVNVAPPATSAFDLGFTLEGTATPGTDYTIPGVSGSSGTVSVPSGATTATIPVTIVDDSIEDSGETIVVRLQGSGGYAVVDPDRVTVTVLNHDPLPPAIESVDPALVAEVRAMAAQTQHGAAHVKRWRRVLVAFGVEDDPVLVPTTAAEAWANAQKYSSPLWPRIAEVLERLEAAPDTPPPPEITVSADAASVTEGGDAAFTLTASPAPAADLPVTVTVATDGDWGVTAGTQTVTIPTTGSATLTLATAGDDADEPDGSVSVTVADGTGYTVGSSGSGTVSVLDDDDAAPAVAAVDPALVAEVRAMAEQTQHGAAHVKRWRRVLVAFGVEEYPGLTPTTLAEAKANAQKYSSPLWPRIVEALEKLEAAALAQQQQDQDQPQQQQPEIAVSAGSAVTEGGDAVFTLTASPAPAADLTVSVTVATDGDWGVTAGTQTVTIPTTGSATLTLATTDDAADEPDGSVTATVQAGSGYTVGASASGTVAVRDDDLPPPVVTIAAKAGSVTEGGDAVFTLTADRAPDADLTVTLAVSETGEGDHVAAADEGPAAVTIPKDATEAVFTLATVNDDADEPDGSAVVTVEAGAGYAVGDPASASVAVKDDDVPSTVPALWVADSTAKEGGRLPVMPFTVRLTPAAQGPARAHPVRVHVSTRPSTPVSAEPGQDYAPGSSDLTFQVGETEKVVWIRIYDDSHDEGSETFEVVLSNARGAAIGDGVAVGTITNDDPMPAAFLARFGRTVAEQALDGIAGRMSAPRSPGMQGAIAGQAVNFGPTDSSGSWSPGSWSGAGGTPATGATPGAAPANGEAALAMAEIARGFGNDAGGPGSGTGIGNGPGFMSPGSLSGTGGTGFGETPPHSRTMTARDALLGSSFSLTGEKDSSGGSMAFWGRAAQGSFDGREGTFSLDGTVTTGMLGADYARGRWLIGLALAQSDGEGDYRDTDVMSRAASQDCPAEAAELCRGAVREGDGTVEASLTAAVPYAAFQASERLKLWGVAGYGTGEVTLKTELGGRYSADTSWSMAAAGLRGDLLAPPAEGSGPALAVTSDALWTRTSSEKTDQLAASDSDATRLRVGLEGSYHVALEDGGSLVPKLEVGARHDGGDAETGFGVELGGGVKWTDPGMGLSLDLSGRTLIAHGNDDLKDRGFSAALAYDPAPETKRGASLSLRQDFGGRATGGLDALFAPETLDDRTGSEAASRWALEAAWGLPAFGGRWTGSPHAGFGLSTGARDYSVGWRLTPEAANAPDLSFGVRATRRESDVQAAEHTFGVELTARW